MNNIFNILLHTEKGMTVGIGLTTPQFKLVVQELPPHYCKKLLKQYRKYAKVLGNLPRGMRVNK